jgi:hypothetical protein
MQLNFWIKCILCISSTNCINKPIVGTSFLQYVMFQGRAMAQAVIRWPIALEEGFAPKSGRVGFVVDKLAVVQRFFPSYLVLQSKYHSTVALHTYKSSGGWIIGPLVAAVQRHSLMPSTWASLTCFVSEITESISMEFYNLSRKFNCSSYLSRINVTLHGSWLSAYRVKRKVQNSNRSRISSGSIVSDYGLDDRAIGVRSPAGEKDFSSSLCVQTGSGAHPASCTMGTGSFPRG